MRRTNRVVKFVRIILAICFVATTIGFFAATIYRLSLDYNENGVYFDEASTTTYDDDAVVAYGGLAVVFLIPTIILLKGIVKPGNKVA